MKYPVWQSMKWRSATRLSEKGWSAELAIPFIELGMKEAPAGKTIKANLTRTEKPHVEFSAWNAVYRRFAEPYSFGDWVFQP
jgi:hypothetical protein